MESFLFLVGLVLGSLIGVVAISFAAGIIDMAQLKKMVANIFQTNA